MEKKPEFELEKCEPICSRTIPINEQAGVTLTLYRDKDGYYWYTANNDPEFVMFCSTYGVLYFLTYNYAAFCDRGDLKSSNNEVKWLADAPIGKILSEVSKPENYQRYEEVSKEYFRGRCF